MNEKDLWNYLNQTFSKISIRKYGIFKDKKTKQIRGNKQGYITIHWKKYRISHLIWFWHYKEMPDRIYHIDGNPDNNVISNLSPEFKKRYARVNFDEPFMLEGCPVAIDRNLHVIDLSEE